MHRLQCTSGLDMALALALLAALGSSCSDSQQAPNSVAGGEIRRFTDTYNTFVGWEWIVNQENIALGVMKGGVLSDFQHKIHDFGDGEVFKGGEFFCDPDDIIFLPKTQEVAYLPYLSWSKDLLVNNNGTFGRLSYLYQPDNLTKKSLPGAPGLSAKIGMRIDKTLSAEHGFLDYESTLLIILKSLLMSSISLKTPHICFSLTAIRNKSFRSSRQGRPNMIGDIFTESFRQVMLLRHITKPAGSLVAT